MTTLDHFAASLTVALIQAVERMASGTRTATDACLLCGMFVGCIEALVEVCLRVLLYFLVFDGRITVLGSTFCHQYFNKWALYTSASMV
jgi:hypothetical protein